MALENCAECGNPFRSQVLWNSYVTNEMVSDLSDEAVASLVLALDEAVMFICSDWNVE
jgi:hypothetical protein